VNNKTQDLFTTFGEKLLFGKRYLPEIHNEIQKVYVADRKPWVIGYSGGKDSTASLQLIWNALKELPKNRFVKPIHIISSDTLVESPVIISHVNSTLKSLQEKAIELGLPFHTQKVKRQITDSFWVNLIGRGYPIPYHRNRWCTDRLKVRPINIFISEKIQQYGEVIIVLGLRKAESSARAQSIKSYAIRKSPLKRHSFFSGAFVYTPVADFTVEDIWKYLSIVPSPWGDQSTNKKLFDLYNDANAEDRPFLMDNETPPMGGRRFGCWVCTVVDKDTSMESLIAKGEEWMKPLLDLRNKLAKLKDPAEKAKYRDHRRRNGKVYFKDGGQEIALGQTTIEKGLPQKLLRLLLEAQIEIHKTMPDFELISDEELHEIRRLWKVEQNDWEDQLPIIYHEVTGRHLNWLQDDVGFFTSLEKEILEDICCKNNFPSSLVAELLELERQYQGMSKRTNIYNRINMIFEKEWRSAEEIISSIKQDHK
jgi:DNA sulfur modification protein DndC